MPNNIPPSELVENFPWSIYRVDPQNCKVTTMVYIKSIGDNYEALVYIDQNHQKETCTIRPEWIDCGGMYYRKNIDALNALRLHIQGHLLWIDEQIRRLTAAAADDLA